MKKDPVMFSSPFARIEIPDESVYDYIFARLGESDLDRVALIDPTADVTLTYRQLRASIDSAAGALAARGVGRGTVVALFSPNSAAFVVAFHAILLTGATVTTVPILATPADLEKQLTDARASWVLSSPPLVPVTEAATAALAIDDDRIIVLGDSESGFTTMNDLLTEGHPARRVAVNPRNDVAVLPYSSGTTGLPKGVMLSHRNLVANVEQARRVIDLGPGDRVLAVLPFFHIYGMTVLLNLALSVRSSIVTMPRFDLANFLGLIERQHCTFLFVAPPIVVALAKHPMVDGIDVSSVRTIFSGAAPLDGATATLAAKRLSSRILQGYGMSELSPISHAVPADRDDIPASSIGVPLPNIECKLVDIESGQPVSEFGPDGLTPPGELWVKGPNVMLGYLGRPDATAETIDSDEFLHTGDVAVMHRDGWFTVIDRVKELIKYKGYQIPPAELEAVLLTNPAIADAAVIGVTNSEGEEIPKAFVVRLAAAELDEVAVMTYVAERVAPYKKIRAVEFIDAIPKSAAGKILRKELRAREASS